MLHSGSDDIQIQSEMDNIDLKVRIFKIQPNEKVWLFLEASIE